MCNDHSNVLVEIPTASIRYSDGSPRPQGNKRAIDGCIAPLVEALNTAGLFTVASCCGHGHRPGNVILADGRELIIARNYEEGRQIDGLFPLDIHGRTSEEREAELLPLTGSTTETDDE